MTPDLMEILCCPLCKGDLTLEGREERDGEIMEGSLDCAACNERYPINGGLPDLRPPDLREG